MPNLTNPDRFKSWQLIRLRGRGPYRGSAWRAAAHIYRDRAINCMEAMRQYQEDMHTWEDAYTDLEARVKLLEELREDVERWRESGGDPRDLRYILDTLEKINDLDTNGSEDRPAESPDGCRV